MIYGQRYDCLTIPRRCVRFPAGFHSCSCGVVNVNQGNYA